jgi:hypothetical protein
MDDPTETIPVTEQFKPSNPLKYEMVRVLKENGYTHREVGKGLDLTKGRISQIVRKLNQNQDLTSPKNVNLASKAHRLILGHFVNPDKVKLKSSIDIKGSDVTKAIDRSYDRFQPIKREADVSTNISFIQINIDGYQCK